MNKSFKQLGFKAGDLVLCSNEGKNKGFVGKLFRLSDMLFSDDVAILIDNDDFSGLTGQGFSWTKPQPWVIASKPVHRVITTFDDDEYCYVLKAMPEE